jgi:hypothetical protein
MRPSLLTLALLALTPALGAADYHLSPAGNDALDGLTPATAWQTIAKVNTTTFAPGDRILFEGGQSFTGNLDFSDESGTAAQPITVASFGTGRATLQAGNGTGITVYNRAGFVLRDLVIAGSGGATNNGRGVMFYADLPGNIRLHHLRLDNLEVHGFRKGGIEFAAWPADGSKTGYTDVKVTRCISRDNLDHGILSYGYYTAHRSGDPVTYAHSDFTVSDCRTYNNLGIANKGNHSGNGIVLSDVNGALIERCVAYNNGQNSNFAGGGPVGIWVWNTGNAVIQFNEAYDNRTATADGGGFDLDGGTVNCVLQYNYSHNNDGPGYLLYQFPGAQPHRDNIVRYNISQNDGRKGYPGGITTGGGLSRAQIYHNTIYTSYRSASTRAIYVLGGSTDIAFRNNVLITTGGAPLVDIASGQSGIVFQGNSYWASGSALTFRDSGVNYSSLAAWRTATGRETNGATPTGLDSDPQLLNPGNAPVLNDPALLSSLTHYRPASTSPLIDAGLDLAQAPWNLVIGTRDFAGIPLPTGARPDIGACELPASPYQAWRIENLGALPAGVTLAQDAATDFDGDGVSQLLEYAFGRDPRAPSASPMLQSQISDFKLQISFSRVPAATDLTYTVLASTDLANPSAWLPIAQGTSGAPLAPVLDRATVSETGTTLRTVTVLDAAPLTTTPRRFLRLQVTRAD